VAGSIRSALHECCTGDLLGPSIHAPTARRRPHHSDCQFFGQTAHRGPSPLECPTPRDCRIGKNTFCRTCPYRITVNNVCPGRMLTDRLRQGSNVRAWMAQGLEEKEVLSELAKDIPLGRIGSPEELGDLVAFLASQQAGYITGTTIQIDGGIIQSIF